MAGHHSDQTSKTFGVQLLALPHHWLFVDVHATPFDLFCGSCAEVLAFWRFVPLSRSPCLVASLTRKHPPKAAFHTSNIAWSAKLKSSILEVYPVKSFSGRGVNGLTMRNHHQQSTAGYKATSSPCTSMGFQSEHESSREPRQTQALQGACCIICSVLFSPSSGFQHPSSIRILRVHHEFRLGVWDRPRLSAQRSPSAWPTAISLDSTAFLLGYTSATSRKKLEVFFNTSRNKQQNQKRSLQK